MKKEIIVLSDIEMGAGNLTDDFISDRALSRFILSLSRKKHPVDLVLNGDTFDLLKCPSQFKPKVYPRHITEKVSLKKMNLVFNAHTQVFSALKNFASKKGREVYFILGNHDADLVFPKVQIFLKSKLGSKRNVKFPGFFYDIHNVYIEHGHQYDIANKIDPEKLFIYYNGKKILNYSFVSFVTISSLIYLKEEHPFLERIKPVNLLLSLYRPLAKKLNRKLIPYVLKSALYYPLRYYKDPTHFFPSGMVGDFFERLKSWDWDVTEIVDIFKRRKIKKKVVVFGHVHKTGYVEETPEQVILRPLPWRDEYKLDEKTGTLLPLPKTYVQIKVMENGRLEWKIRTYPIKRTALKFEDVVKNEKGSLLKAAGEEGYVPINI